MTHFAYSAAYLSNAKELLILILLTTQSTIMPLKAGLGQQHRLSTQVMLQFECGILLLIFRRHVRRGTCPRCHRVEVTGAGPAPRLGQTRRIIPAYWGRLGNCEYINGPAAVGSATSLHASFDKDYRYVFRISRKWILRVSSTPWKCSTRLRRAILS